MALLDFLKRDTVKDPFGGEDMFDGESRFAGKGPKIALAASVAMFLILAGGVAVVMLTGKAPPPPAGGSLADIEVVDDAAAPAAAQIPSGAPAAAPQAARPGTKTPPPAVADATAATDRSIDRRPWLSAAPSSDSQRLGVQNAAAPAIKPAAAQTASAAPALPSAVGAKPAPDAKPALMTPPPAPPVAPTVTAANTPANMMAKSPAAETAKPAAAAPGKAAPVEIKDASKDTPKDTEVAAADAFGPAPGAPNHFALPAGAETGPAVAGGRPRLAEPQEPPTDKTAISAPPPRFANIADVKKDDVKKDTAKAATAKVAVVVEGLGLNQAATDAAISKLPAAVTLAFSPYARDLKKWMDKAKASGHEVLIEVPMESKEFPAEDPGPLGLLTSLDQKQNGERLDTILKQSGPAVGVLDPEGSKFRESDPNIAAVFAKLKEHNLFYVQGQPGVRVGEATVPVAVADVVLDERPFRADVDARLDYTERLARYQGSAVASLGPKPVGFERLVLWLDQAQKKGVALAPISQVLIR